MSKYVTRTGRALSPGRVTRKSLERSRRSDEKPLPIELMCHPKALSPLTHNPNCLTFKPWAAHYALYCGMAEDRPNMFERGEQLSGQGPWELYVHGHGTFRHHDMNSAFGWREAARDCGYDCVLRQGE